MLLLVCATVGCQVPSLHGRGTSSRATTAVATTGTMPHITTATPQATPGTPSVLEAPTPAATPKASGSQTLTLVGSASGPATLDPALVQDADSAFVVRQVFRGLVGLDDEMRPVPELAQRIDVSADGLTYTFHLWDNSTFDNGRRITASDVKYSLDRATDPALVGGRGDQLPAQNYLSDIEGASARMAGKASSISGIEVVDSRTVRIHLVRPSADFLLKLSGTAADIVDRSNVQRGGDWWRSPDGSGPFALTKWTPNDRITLQGHKGYEPHPPTLQSVVILIGASANQPMTLYERGQIDATNASLGDIDRIREPHSALGGQLHVSPLLAVSYVMLNPNVAPLNNSDLRRALIESFDSAKVANVTFGGLVKPADGLLPRGLDGHDWPATLPAYNLAAGQALLRKADGGKPPSLTIYTADADAPVAMKKVYERDLKLSVDVVEPEFNDLITEMQQRTLEAFSVTWVADFPDPESFLRELFYSTSPNNFLGYDNPKVDHLLDQAQAASDPATRARLFAQAQQAIIDDNVVLPIYDDMAYVLIKPYVHGMAVTPLGILGLESVWVTK